MNQQEIKSSVSLGLIMTFRMLGLFMILPVFATFAEHLPHSTPQLVGLALGIYGFTQASLQIPFGYLSDRIGRKKMIVIGLCFFAIGSVVAACSSSIYGIIFGRALQGTGAVGSVVIALLADLTRPEQRTKAMAIVGSSIGVAFALAMVLGPVLNNWISVPGIFWLTSVLALLGIVLLIFIVPNPKIEQLEKITHVRWQSLISDNYFLRLNASIFIQHAILTASFVALPVMLQQLNLQHQSLFYLPILVGAYALMVPFIIMSEKRGKSRAVFIGAISAIAISQLWLVLFHQHIANYAAALLLFFTAFTLLEALLPSTVSKYVPQNIKGAAMGIYSTLQFLGIFIGGVLGGVIFSVLGGIGVFGFCAALAILWLAIMFFGKSSAMIRAH